MPTCSLSYIPEYLHYNQKPVIPIFGDSEKLYRRVKNPSNPFSDLKLWDISCNRSGTETEIICHKEDTLLIIKEIEDDTPNIYSNFTVATLEINSIFPDGLTRNVYGIGDTQQVGDFAVITLLHDPLPCNYSHCIIQFSLRGTLVTGENYDAIFRSKPLKNACRFLLHNAEELKKLADNSDQS